MATLIETVSDNENGVEARVYDVGARGFSVSLFDVDSGETAALVRTFPTHAAAVAYARGLALLSESLSGQVTR